MKKLLSMVLAVLMLLTASAAFAEEGGDVVTLDVFYASSRPMNEATELTHQYMIDNLGIDFNLIQGDGGINGDNASAIVGAGCDCLVAGNAFFKSADKKQTVARLKGLI